MKKMNEKGLTLVELMAVISILAVVALIVTPNILGSIKKYRNKMYDTQVNNILSAAKNWAADEIDKKHCLVCIPESNSGLTEEYCLENGGEGCKETDVDGRILVVYLAELMDDGYLKEDLENPKTDKLFSRCGMVVITRDLTTGEFLYEAKDLDTVIECTK